MAQAQKAEKHIIWRRMDLNCEDWKPSLKENYLDRMEDEYRGLMHHEVNDSYFEEKRAGLANICVSAHKEYKNVTLKK